MNKLFRAAGLGLLLAASSAVQAAEKIAVVDVGSIFHQLPQSKTVAKKLESEFKGRATDLEAQQKALQAQLQNLQRNASTMKASERTKLEKEVFTKRQEFEVKAQAFEKDNRTRQMQERDVILKKIQAAVKSVAASKGYDVVLDAGSVAYAANNADITAEVLKQVK